MILLIVIVIICFIPITFLTCKFEKWTTKRDKIKREQVKSINRLRDQYRYKRLKLIRRKNKII
jgi:hypothetical protein